MRVLSAIADAFWSLFGHRIIQSSSLTPNRMLCFCSCGGRVVIRYSRFDGFALIEYSTCPHDERVRRRRDAKRIPRARVLP